MANGCCAAEEGAKASLRRLVVGLADSKRLLGIRYSDWIIGAPSLETGISLASMAQDEWGHARLVYAMLKELDENPEYAERERPAEEYANVGALDSPFMEWPEVVAAIVVVDGALTAALTGLAGGSLEVARSRVPKMLAEEEFHTPFGNAWYRRLAAASTESADLLRQAALRQLPGVLSWLAKEDALRAEVVAAGFTSPPSQQLAIFADAAGPLLALSGIDLAGVALAEEWDATRGRAPGAPKEETVVRARGDLNRTLFVR